MTKKIERDFFDLYGIEIFICQVQYNPGLLNLFGQKEKSFLKNLFEKHRRDWIASRTAIKELLGDSEQIDLLNLSFPTPGLSITHTHEIGLAAKTANPDYFIGIDYEVGRTAPQETARFYLTQKEQNWLFDGHFDDWDLLRIWTIKEAVFKSDLKNNANRQLRDYELESFHLDKGEVFALNDVSSRFKFYNTTHNDGALSISVAQ